MRKRGRIVLDLGTREVRVEAVRKDGLPDQRSQSLDSPYYVGIYEAEGLDALRHESRRFYGGLVIRKV